MKASALSVSKWIITSVLAVLLISQWKNVQSFHINPVTLASNWLFLVIWVLLLAPVNWFLECLRLRSTVANGKDQPITEYWKMIMSGFTFGFITPGRIGDYAGRAVMAPGKRTEIIVATWIAGLCQNWFNLSVGMTGAMYLLLHYYNQYILLLVLFSILFLSGISILLLYPQGRKALLEYLIYFVKKYLKFIPLPEYLDASNLAHINLKLFIFSGLRYILYLSQYIMIAYAFGILVPAVLLVSIISTILLIQSMIHLPFIAGLLSRAEISMLVWSLIQVPFDKALTVSFVVWMINLMLPALIGLKYVLSLKPLHEIH